MSETEDNRAVALSAMQALGTGDIEAARRLIHEDATWWALGHGTMSRDTLLSNTEKAMAEMIETGLEIVGTTAEGDRVAIEQRGKFTLRDGRIYHNEYHMLLIVRGGRVVAGREYLDTALVERTFGRAFQPD